MSDGTEGLDADQWHEKLALIGRKLAELGSSAYLTVVGSAPGILSGQPARTSMDLDVWSQKSDFDRSTLREAVEAAGLLFDPKGYEPSGPYIQLVEEGIVQVGKFRPEPMGRYGALQMAKAPVVNIIASKLTRVSETDLYDIAWMMGTYNPEPEAIGKVIATFPREAKLAAKENMEYLAVHTQFAKPPEVTASPDYASGVVGEQMPSQLPKRALQAGRKRR